MSLSRKRFAAALLINGAAAAALVALTANGVLAASFSISGLPFTVTADRLEGTGFEQFAALGTMVPGSPNDATTAAAFRLPHLRMAFTQEGC